MKGSVAPRAVECGAAFKEDFKRTCEAFALVGMQPGRGERLFRIGCGFDKLDALDTFGIHDGLVLRLRGHGPHGPVFPNSHHMTRALLLEDALDALDGEPLIVEQMADALEELYVIGAVIAPPAAALERLDLREPRFPETQHMLW